MSKRVVVIADGTTPLGVAAARLASARGYAVALNAPTGSAPALAEQAATDIRAAGGVAIAVAADIEREDEVERLFKAADELGQVAGLVNNAGQVLDDVRLDTADQAQLVQLFSANITAAFLCAGAAIRRMSRKHGGEGGSIVNVSSPASRHGSPGHAVAYAASKGALDAFTNGLAMEVAREGVRVNSVRVAIVPADEPSSSASAALTNTDPAQLATPILWLMSDEADYCHGIHIAATGGRLVNA